MPAKRQPTTIDEYIAGFPEAVRSRLARLRETIGKAAPKATEAISYQIPTFRLDGKYLIYFAGWKDHTAVYPIPAGDEAFAREIEPYRAAKGSLHFPHDKPLPLALVRKAVKFAVKARQAG
jgi:uncharacterized protein YdhG (YjbR/CyaY superfamily)